MKNICFGNIGKYVLEPRSNYIKKFSPDFYMGMHNHGYFEIMYAQRGNFQFEFSTTSNAADGVTTVTVNQGSFVFIDAYVYHRLHITEDNVEIYNIEFEPKAPENTQFDVQSILPVNYNVLLKRTSLQQLAEAPHGCMIVPNLSGVDFAMHNLILLLTKKCASLEDACSVQLGILSVFNEIAKSITMFKENEIYFAKKVYLYIKSHLHKKLTLEEIAEAVGYNKSYLTTQFKKQTGKTIMQTVCSMRISKSLQLLKNTNLPVTDIATQVGFSSYTKMAYAFQKTLGISPSDCRKHFINDEIAHPTQTHQSSAIRINPEDFLLDDEAFYSSYYKKEVPSAADKILKNY